MLHITDLETKFYRIAAVLVLAVFASSACVPVQQADVEAGAEIIEEDGLTDDSNLVVEAAGLDAEPMSVGVMNAGGTTIRATRLLDYDFRNTNGDVTGEIDNILIDVSTGQILFVTIEYGGFLDLGDTHLAMPMGAFSWGPENELVLNIEEQRLENFPSLGEDWPDLDDKVWDDEINQFWLDIGVVPSIEIDEETSQVMYISDLLDSEIGDIDFGEGEIHDVLINLSQSQGRYVIVDYEDELFNDNLVAVPFGAFHGRMIDDQLHFDANVNLEMIQKAPMLDRTGFDEADIFEPDFDRDIVDYWGNEGYDVEHKAGL